MTSPQAALILTALRNTSSQARAVCPSTRDLLVIQISQGNIWTYAQHAAKLNRGKASLMYEQAHATQETGAQKAF